MVSATWNTNLLFVHRAASHSCIEVMRLTSFLTCARISAILSGKTQVWAKVAVLSDA